MDLDKPKKRKFAFIPRLKNSTHAWRGIRVLFRATPHAWSLCFFGAMAVYMGFILNISTAEWAAIVVVIGVVIIAEAINTAIEIDIDLTSPEYHPYARDTKDVAAGAVLLACILAGVVGLIVFLPKILAVI